MRRIRLVVTALAAAVVLSAPAPGQAQAQGAHPSAVVYVSDRDSRSSDDPSDDVYLQRPGDRQAYRLTDAVGAERYPTLSPDGRWLAFVRFQIDASGAVVPAETTLLRCRVRYVRHRVTCGAERSLVRPVSTNPVAWTPDSRSLVYNGVPSAEGDVDLYRVDVRSRATANLTKEPADGAITQDTQPSVSPDGRWLYYSVGRAVPTGADLYRRPLRGAGPAEQLTAAPNNDVGVDVSPDGRRLVFHSNRADVADFDVYTMRAEPEGPDNPAVDLTSGLRAPDGTTSSQERRPSWSPDGRRIAFMWFTDPPAGVCFGCNDGEVFTMRRDGSDVQNLTANNPHPGEPTTTPLYADITPDWGQVRGRGF